MEINFFLNIIAYTYIQKNLTTYKKINYVEINLRSMNI